MKLFITLLLLFLSCYSHAQGIITGTAKYVYDGDTFTLFKEDGTKIKIRIAGIDAPEVAQPYGIEARNYARKILQDKKVRVYLEPGETYGRKLGIVITEDGLNFNYEMVATGHAWWYSYYSKDKYLEAAFKHAQSNDLGLWGTISPVAPWEWRKEHKNN